MFSVAVPCWGSSRYVADALQTLSALADQDLEIVVSVDPGSPDYEETHTALRTVRGLSFNVIEPECPLSMAEHYEWCLRNVSGRWVTILGADDGMLPWGLSLVRRVLAVVPDADALMFRRAYYFWPGVESVYGETRISLTTEASIRTVDGEKALRRVLRGHGEHFDLPQIYTNNFVRSDVIGRIRDASEGRVFHERNPDVYSGVAVSHFAQNIIRCEVPAFWTGTSPSSMGLKQRQAIVYGLDEARDAVQVHFVDKSNTTGHGVATEIGDELWLMAQDSPMYVLSAYLRFCDVVRPVARQIAERQRRALIRSAFAATLVRASRDSRPAADGSRRRVLRHAIRHRARALGISWERILLRMGWAAFVSLLGLAASAARKTAQLVFPRPRELPRGKLRITGRDRMTSLFDANVYVAAHAATALPAGLSLRVDRTRKPWPIFVRRRT